MICLAGPMGGVTLGRGGSPASYPIKQSSSATQLIGRSKFGGGASGFASLDNSRDSSRERLAGGGFPFPAAAKPPSRHPSGRSQESQERVGRPDSRQSDNMPDLERFQDAASSHSQLPPSRTSSATRAADRQRMINRQTTPPPTFPSSSDTSAAVQPKFNPSSDVLEKRKKVLQSMANDKQLVKEAKGRHMTSFFCKRRM